MLSLNDGIGEWRRQMNDNGINNPAVLAELESHLRDELEQQVRLGLDEQHALQAAIQRIGQPTLLKNEFAKVGGAVEAQARLKDIIFTLAGIPNPNFAISMNTSSSNIEPGWATYLKAAVFLLPAISLWGLSIIFV